jgi:hypothetical protein
MASLGSSVGTARLLLSSTGSDRAHAIPPPDPHDNASGCLPSRNTRGSPDETSAHSHEVPMYLWILSWFFLYCYPIARLTLHLERRFMVQL